MPDFFAPLTPEYSLQIPEDPAALIGWVIWFSLLVFVILRFRDRKFEINRKNLVWFAVLSLLVLVFTPFFGVRLRINPSLGVGDAPFQYVMFLAAVPWLAAGGLIGLVPATLLAGLSGLLMAYLTTNNIFTPLIFVTQSLIFTWSIRQNYRTGFFRLLRFPLIGSLISLILSLPLVFFGLGLSIKGDLALRVAVVADWMPEVVVSLGGMLLTGGLICVFVWLFTPKTWGSRKPLQTAPGEKHLRFRLIAISVPLSIALFIVMVAGSWLVAEKSTRRNLVGQLIDTSNYAANGINAFIGTGQNLITEMAESGRLVSGSQEEARDFLTRQIDRQFFFNRLLLVTADGEIIIGIPESELDRILIMPEELAAMQMAVSGIPPQTITIPSRLEGDIDRVGFVARLPMEESETRLVLYGQTDFQSNPLAEPFVNALDHFAQTGGESQIVDHQSVVVFHTDEKLTMTTYTGMSYGTTTFFEGVSPDGRLMLQYYQPLEAVQGWAVLTSMPGLKLQVMVWQAILPVIAIGTVAILMTIIIAFMSLTPVIKDINQLEGVLEKVAVGNTVTQLAKRPSAGEMQQLGDVFQRMLESINNRMLNQADLLSVSDRVAGQLNFQEVLHVIMTSAVARGVSSVRVILLNDNDNEDGDANKKRFGMGKHARRFAALDDQIIAKISSQGSLVWQEYFPAQVLQIPNGTPDFASVIAMPLKWEDTLSGVLWVTFQERRNLEPEEIDFFKLLAQKASTALASITTYHKTFTLKQQVEIVLDFLPDAIFILDRDDCVVYHNKGVKPLLNQGSISVQGKELASIVESKELSTFLRDKLQTGEPEEIVLDNGTSFHYLSRPIQIDSVLVGRVVILKDITEQKAQESQKSEFVTTVSHELRSPLTLIQGYAKILRLTGNLNEQQSTYVSNIIDGVEEMRSLVQNLLDIGRLEAGEPLEVTQIPVDEIAQRIMESMEVQAKQKNIKMELSLPEEPLIIEANNTYLTQALKNLLENAVKFTKMGGNVGLRVRGKDDRVIFAVHDTGIGIAPLDQRHLFEKFQRFNPQVGKEQLGSGLGLAIVKSIAERHGGKVWLESQLGRGSTFYMQIPIKSQIK